MSALDKNLLSNFRVMQANDPGIAEQRVKSGFGATGVRIRKSSNEFVLRANHLQLTSLGLTYVATTGEVSASFAESGSIRQIFNITGIGSVTTGRLSEAIAPGLWSSVLPTGEKCAISFGPNYAHLVLKIKRDAIYGYLRALLDDEVNGELEFLPRAIDNDAMRSLRMRVFQFATEYNARGRYFSSLANAEFERMMAMAFLLSHYHTYSNRLLREPARTSTAAVRIAAEYIESNWNKKIDVVKLAGIANVSSRSLFRQFQKERGESPAEFVRNIRLHKARMMLENPDINTSVTQVALKCGFNNSGRFAHEYQTTFGELPSKALLRALNR